MSDRCLCAVVHRPLRNSSNSSVVEKPLVSVDEQAAISALLSLFLSCFSRFPEITVQPSIHKKICATQHIRCTSKSRSISKCWSSWRYCRDTATSHMKCCTDRHSFGAVACQMANIAKIPKSEGCKKVPKKFGRNFLGMFSHRMKREISKNWLLVLTLGHGPNPSVVFARPGPNYVNIRC